MIGVLTGTRAVKGWTDGVQVTTSEPQVLTPLIDASRHTGGFMAPPCGVGSSNLERPRTR